MRLLSEQVCVRLLLGNKGKVKVEVESVRPLAVGMAMTSGCMAGFGFYKGAGSLRLDPITMNATGIRLIKK